MELRELHDEREADPGASGAYARALHEGLEDPLAVLGPDPGTVVLDGDQRAVIGAFDANPDAGVPGGVLHGIGEKVLDDPLDHRRIRLHVDRSRVQLEPPFGDHIGPRHELADERAEVHGPQTRREALPLESVEVQQVRHDPVEASRVLHDP